MGSTGRFQGVLEPSRTVGDVDVKADAPKGSIASFPEVRHCSMLFICRELNCPYSVCPVGIEMQQQRVHSCRHTRLAHV